MRVHADDQSTCAARAAKRCAVSRESSDSLRGSMRIVLLGVVNFYIAILSPFFGGACKFYPSCSQYAREAIARHGARTGAWLALKRLGRCRPFTQGGYDPVPDEEEIAMVHAMARQKELMKWTR